MEINPNLKPGGLRADANPAEVRNWRVGQVLNAVATGAERAGSAPLRIGGQTFQAQVPFPVQPGDRLLLEVVRTGTVPLLRPVGTATRPDAIQAALRAALPQQGGLPPLLANIAQLATARDAPPLAPAVLDAARKLLQRLPSDRQAGTAEGLRRAVDGAGTRLEAKLAQAATGRSPATPIGDDFKAGLLRLREALNQALRSPPPPTAARAAATAPAPEVRTQGLPPATAPTTTSAHPAGPAPAHNNPSSANVPTNAAATSRGVAPLLPPLTANQPQAQARAMPFPLTLEPNKWLHGLTQQVESALARVQLNQLATQPADGEQRQVWLLELPLRRDNGVDVLHLRIEREPEHTDSPGARSGNGWTVRLAFDLEGLGPVQSRVGLHGGLVSSAFWAERPETAELLQRHLGTLREQLEAAGLDVAGLTAQLGRPQAPDPGPAPASGIVDERA